MSLNALQMIVDRIEAEARKLAWVDYRKDHDESEYDGLDGPTAESNRFPHWSEPDEYREKVVATLFDSVFKGGE